MLIPLHWTDRAETSNPTERANHMKKTLVTAFAIALFCAAPAALTVHAKGTDLDGDRDGTGCKIGHKTCKPVPVPEPSSFMMLSTGLIAVGGLFAVGRKKFADNA